ncbi:CDP-diacylglycerol--serine O-phosphatidyltransferase [Fodinicola feengrottensis]|uniref:CDP-diacylglycerol--serine O-phosphatidyltransferase n=1 Tax=Fodinicola feengrottensis TaxID=435914 RepID=A0ABN2GD71_9ACTN
MLERPADALVEPTIEKVPAKAIKPEPEVDAPVVVPLLPGPQTVARKIKFGLVTATSIASLVFGTSAVLVAFSGYSRLGALLLIGSVVCDGLDGPLARKFGVATPFGAQLDSLVDMCSFGVAAPVVSYVWLTHAGAPIFLVAPSCLLIAAGAALRLARFNVSPKNSKYFCGVPTTLAAGILAMFALLVRNPATMWWLSLLVGMLAILMVSTFPYANLTRVLRLPPWLWLGVVAGVVLIDATVTFIAVVTVYLVSGPLLWMRQRHVLASR